MPYAKSLSHGICILLLTIFTVGCSDFQSITVNDACENMQEVCKVEYNNLNSCIDQTQRRTPDESTIRCLTEANSCGEIRSCYSSMIE